MELTRERVIQATALFLGIPVRDVEQVLYCGKSIVWSAGETPLRDGQLLSPKEAADWHEKYEDDFHDAAGYSGLRLALEWMRARSPEETDLMRLASLLELPPRTLGRLLFEDCLVNLGNPPLRGSVWTADMAEQLTAEGSAVIPGREAVWRYLRHLLDWLEAEDDRVCRSLPGVPLDAFAPDGWPEWASEIARARAQEAEELARYRRDHPDDL